MRPLTIALSSALATTLVAGCSLIPSAAPQPVRYACDAGKGFSVTYLPEHDAATIDIEGSHFSLQAEPTEAGGQRFGCGVLTLWRDGDSARVDMQGVGMFENCRPRK